MPITSYSHSPKRSKNEAMNMGALAFLLILLLLAGAGIFLATRTIPAPAHSIEKVIPNDRFFK